MYYTDDPHADWDRYCDEQEQQAEKFPRCCGCRQRIYDDHLWDIDGELYHEDCAAEHFRKSTDGYME